MVIKVVHEVDFRSIFCAPSQKFKIMAIPTVLAHGKSYEYGFTKKHDGHKLCANARAKSSFDRFFVRNLINSKYWPFRTFKPMGSRTSMVSQKIAMVINFA
ncbi:hypothetical protein BHM03_00019670 [Ensete ventricosum]|uniref:Uncharacterized protein n=1 Tax=Ensete ventricosum TaxID=4639 RepID=A0A445MFM7_ENSVE|nr:hypothetical protein BHM03_00019670 [Ensete ventricosum]